MKALLIQHHVPKTAGTSVRKVTRANFRPGELAQIDWWTEPFRSLLAEAAAEPGEAARWTRRVESVRAYYEGLPRRDRIRCFMGHLAQYLIPVVRDRPVRAACMLRDPVERVASLVRSAEVSVARRGEREGGFGVLMAAMRERGWSLADVYTELGGRFDLPPELYVPFEPLFNGQARHLLAGVTDPRALPFQSGTAGLDAHRDQVFKLLSDVYVVGTQDRFAESMRLFADSFGWKRLFLPRSRSGPPPGQGSEIDRETLDLIRTHNQLDAELHAHFSERLRSAPGITTSSRLRGSVYLRSAGLRGTLRRGRARASRTARSPEPRRCGSRDSDRSRPLR